MKKLDYSRDIVGQLREEEAERSRGHDDKARALETKLLEDTTYGQYLKGRRELETTLAEPDLPQDEMSYSDYCKSRDAEEAER